jgi:phage-related protein
VIVRELLLSDAAINTKRGGLLVPAHGTWSLIAENQRTAGLKPPRGVMRDINSRRSSEGTSPTISSRSGIGKGVEEIRVSEPSGAYRVVYVARRVEAVYVLHAFHKKTQTTPQRDLEIAKRRFGQLLGGRI